MSSTSSLHLSAAGRKIQRQIRCTESLAGNIGGKMERNRIKIGCLPYAIVFLSILIWIVLALIFGSETNKAENFGELVLPPAERSGRGHLRGFPGQSGVNEDEGTWVIAAFEVPENWRIYE